MIVFEKFWSDFLIHFVFLYILLNVIFYLKKASIVIALIGALIITYINQRFYPEFRLIRMFE